MGSCSCANKTLWDCSESILARTTRPCPGAAETQQAHPHNHSATVTWPESISTYHSPSAPITLTKPGERGGHARPTEAASPGVPSCLRTASALSWLPEASAPSPRTRAVPVTEDHQLGLGAPELAMDLPLSRGTRQRTNVRSWGEKRPVWGPRLRGEGQGARDCGWVAKGRVRGRGWGRNCGALRTFESISQIFCRPSCSGVLPCAHSSTQSRSRTTAWETP